MREHSKIFVLLTSLIFVFAGCDATLRQTFKFEVWEGPETSCYFYVLPQEMFIKGAEQEMKNLELRRYEKVKELSRMGYVSIDNAEVSWVTDDGKIVPGKPIAAYPSMPDEFFILSGRQYGTMVFNGRFRALKVSAPGYETFSSTSDQFLHSEMNKDYQECAVYHGLIILKKKQ